MKVDAPKNEQRPKVKWGSGAMTAPQHPDFVGKTAHEIMAMLIKGKSK